MVENIVFEIWIPFLIRLDYIIYVISWSYKILSQLRVNSILK